MRKNEWNCNILYLVTIINIIIKKITLIMEIPPLNRACLITVGLQGSEERFFGE